jgi:hypothetical protein
MLALGYGTGWRMGSRRGVESGMMPSAQLERPTLGRAGGFGREEGASDAEAGGGDQYYLLCRVWL